MGRKQKSVGTRWRGSVFLFSCPGLPGWWTCPVQTCKVNLPIHPENIYCPPESILRTILGAKDLVDLVPLLPSQTRSGNLGIELQKYCNLQQR